MPRYRVNLFVQHREAEPNIGCHVTVKVVAPTCDQAVVSAMHEAVKICMEYHPELNGQPYRPILKDRPILMKALKETKG